MDKKKLSKYQMNKKVQRKKVTDSIKENKPQKSLVSIDDARAILGGICRETVYVLLRKKSLDNVKIGARNFITVASLEKFTGKRVEWI